MAKRGRVKEGWKGGNELRTMESGWMKEKG